MQYLWQYFYPDIPVVRGQAPGIWVMFISVACAIALAIRCRRKPVPDRAVMAFLLALAAGWLVHLALVRIHGDGYDYASYLPPVIIALIWWRFPTGADIRASLLVLGWSASILLVFTRATELLGVIPMAPVPDILVQFEVGEYWLPLSGWLGPEGRWPGPMGGTAFTGMVGAFLLVLAVALRCRSSWVFAIVGGMTLLLTSSRGSYAAAAAGLAVVVLFSDARILRRISMRWRIGTAAVGGIAVLGLLIRSNPGLTGRTTFWRDFIDLWATSPITGVGASGYETGTIWTQESGSAHSLYIDELARNGIIGLVFTAAVFALALYLGLRSATRGQPAPLALTATFVVLGIVNTPAVWLAPSFIWLFLILPPLWTVIERPPSSADPEQGANRLAFQEGREI